MTDTDHTAPLEDALPVSELIRRRVPELPRAERQVGRSLLVHSPTIGLESSSRLAEIVGTSGPTVIRFVNRLGFATYADFQRAWRAELAARLVSPVDAFRHYEPESDAAHRLARTADQSVDAVRETVAQLPPGEFETAVELLAARRRVFVFGGWFSDVLARHLAALLQTSRSGVAHLEQPPVQRATSLLDAGRHDVAVVFDFRRYEHDSLVAAQHHSGRGATGVLVADRGPRRLGADRPRRADAPGLDGLGDGALPGARRRRRRPPGPRGE